MATNTAQLLQAAESAFAAQVSELETMRAKQQSSVVTKTATGSGDINHAFLLDRRYRLVFMRCHFVGTSGSAPFTLSVDSASGAAHDSRLYTISRAGTDRDVHFRIPAEESREPSPWTFQASDGIRIAWTNPDSGNITWGLEVGLAIAS